VARDLLQRYRSGGQSDLSRLILVLPGAQAGRRLLELLSLQSGGKFHPPDTQHVLTVGTLPEQLYTPKLPFASDLTQQLAWAQAIRELPQHKRELLFGQPPAEDEVAGWLALGEVLARQHRELAADRLDFARVAQLGASLPTFCEAERWEVLSEVQRAYLALLDSLQLWDVQTARLVAIEKRECHTDYDIVLIGTVDLNGTLRAMLQQVATNVTTYIHAPEELSEHFDEFGCLIPEVWNEVTIPLASERVHLAGSPADQAEQAARIVASYQGKYAAEEITLGVPDETLVPQLRRLFQRCGIATRWVVERELSRTGPYLLLSALADLLDRQTTPEFAAFVRHPDVTRWLDRQRLPRHWLTTLDEYIVEHLATRLDEIIPPARESDRQSRNVATLRRLRDTVIGLLAPLQGTKRPVTDWVEPILDVLQQVYGVQPYNPDVPSERLILSACEKLASSLRAFHQIPDPLRPHLQASGAIRLMLEQLANDFIPAQHFPGAIQIYGWLELPLDDAPALVVTSLNEGFVPTSLNQDVYLPNALREHLGLEDNQRRYARDAYALSAILHSRRDVDLVLGRLDAQGDPLRPSRLLFATDAEEIARRVQQFYGPDSGQKRPPLAGKIRPTHSSPQFAVPQPVPLDFCPLAVSVTELADYLACPYSYYLRRSLGLAPLSDAVYELDPRGFGNLLHVVLQQFGRSELRESGVEKEIAEFLSEALDQFVQACYGADRLISLQVQVEQARARLAAFARWQADWLQQGWDIQHAEIDAPRYPVQLATGEKIFLKGRIDRIDFHPGKGEWAIFDYKTGDKGPDPRKDHLQPDGRWVKLQLPLYRHLARGLGVTGRPQLGYIILPRDTSKVGVRFAEWSEPELARADATAWDTLERIVHEEFWPPGEPCLLQNDFASILQTTVRGGN
jgi:RecB family exonuclease